MPFSAVDQSEIETVIPRGIGGKVMILAGGNKRQIGHIIGRNDKRYSLEIQLIGVKEVVTVDFDHACEYQGNVEDMDYE